MSSAEYSIWLDEHANNPWGEQLDLVYAAYIAMTVVNFAGKFSKKQVDLKDMVSSMQASIHQMLNPIEVPEIGPDDIFGKFGD